MEHKLTPERLAEWRGLAERVVKINDLDLGLAGDQMANAASDDMEAEFGAEDVIELIDRVEGVTSIAPDDKKLLDYLHGFIDGSLHDLIEKRVVNPESSTLLRARDLVDRLRKP